MEITSVKSLFEAIDGTFQPHDLQMYRGQTRENWPLIPSIGRHNDTRGGHTNWRDYQEQVVKRFLRLARPYIGDPSPNYRNALVLGQHHGLPTCLLDTSTNPLKALFFAVNHPVNDKFNGALCAFSYSRWREDVGQEDNFQWGEDAIPFLPEQLNPRLTAQEGAFIVYPLAVNTQPLRPIDELKNDHLSIVKFIIPAESKKILRQELSILGVQFRLLFPDLDGVAKGVKLDYFEDELSFRRMFK